MDGQHRQTCLYEILGLERSASVDDIRSAYRKLALKFHPDKIQQSGASPEACQEATVRFQEIARAYEVLGDPTERAWYDSHRSEILSSSSSPSGAPADFYFNVWPYFSPSSFSGYGESGQGFYAVYNDVFQTLHEQEKAFVRAYGEPPISEGPRMGGPSTPYAEVARFYNHWLGFSTVKDFSWCDEFKLTMAPNRKVRRLMEEENKKIRRKARKEFNDAVRQLAVFVKKRDKRVMERQLELQRLQREKELMVKLKRQQAKAEKIMKAKQYEEAEWTKVSSYEGILGGEEDSDVDENQGSYNWDISHRGRKEPKGTTKNNQELFCIVCNKRFRSEQQWKNHEKSNKHLERTAALKDSFLEDEEEEDEDSLETLVVEDAISDVNVWEERADALSKIDVHNNDAVHYGEETKNDLEVAIDRSGFKDEIQGSDNVTKSPHISGFRDTDTEELSHVLITSQLNSQSMNISKRNDMLDETGSLLEQNSDVEDEESDILRAMLNSHRNRKEMEYKEEHDVDNICINQKSVTAAFENGFLTVKSEEGFGESTFNGPKKQQSKRRGRLEKKQAAAEDRYDALAELSSLEQTVRNIFLNDGGIDLEKAGMGKHEELLDRDLRNEVSDSVSEKEEKEDAMKLKTEKLNSSSKQSTVLKRHKANMSATVENDQGRKQVKGRKGKGGSKLAPHSCETCGQDFESRNQLFKHIDATNHSVLRAK